MNYRVKGDHQVLIALMVVAVIILTAAIAMHITVRRMNRDDSHVAQQTSELLAQATLKPHASNQKD